MLYEDTSHGECNLFSKSWSNFINHTHRIYDTEMKPLVDSQTMEQGGKDKRHENKNVKWVRKRWLEWVCNDQVSFVLYEVKKKNRRKYIEILYVLPIRTQNEHSLSLHSGPGS